MTRSAYRFMAITGILVLPWLGMAQDTSRNELAGIFKPEPEERSDYSEPLRSATNDVKIIASLGYLFYKSCISSQDRPSCVFTPSCSVYAMESIRQKGLFLGWLRAFDRLSRCHGLVHHTHYPFDAEKQRYHDPVE